MIGRRGFLVAASQLAGSALVVRAADGVDYTEIGRTFESRYSGIAVDVPRENPVQDAEDCEPCGELIRCEPVCDPVAPKSATTDGYYPTRGGWWSVNGYWNTNRAYILSHMINSPNHRGAFDAAWLRTLDWNELHSLHSDHHEGRVKRIYIGCRKTKQQDREAVEKVTRPAAPTTTPAVRRRRVRQNRSAARKFLSFGGGRRSTYCPT